MHTDMELDIKTVLMLVSRNLWMILLSFITLFVGVFFLFEYNKTPLYTAEATMYVSNKSPEQAQQQPTSSNASVNDLNTAQQLIKTYSIVLKSHYAISSVSEHLTGQHDERLIRDSLKLSAVSSTEVMSITATTKDPQLSADICNAVIAVAPEILKDKVKVGTCEIIDQALVPVEPSNPRSFKLPAVAGLAGAMLAVGLTILIYLLDTKIKSTNDFKSRYDVVVLGEVPDFGNGKKRRGRKYYAGGYTKYVES